MSDTKRSSKKQQGIQELYEKIKPIKAAMLTTATADGELHSRPMATQAPEDLKDDGTLWFFTYASASKVNEVGQNQQVNLSYTKPGDQLYVSVSGTGTLVRDSQRVRELWRPFYKAWFPDGPDNPDLALLLVRIQSAEYWSAPSGKTGIMYTLAKAFTPKEKDVLPVDVKLNV